MKASPKCRNAGSKFGAYLHLCNDLKPYQSLAYRVPPRIPQAYTHIRERAYGQESVPE